MCYTLCTFMQSHQCPTTPPVWCLLVIKNRNMTSISLPIEFVYGIWLIVCLNRQMSLCVDLPLLIAQWNCQRCGNLCVFRLYFWTIWYTEVGIKDSYQMDEEVFVFEKVNNEIEGGRVIRAWVWKLWGVAVWRLCSGWGCLGIMIAGWYTNKRLLSYFLIWWCLSILVKKRW